MPRQVKTRTRMSQCSPKSSNLRHQRRARVYRAYNLFMWPVVIRKKWARFSWKRACATSFASTKTKQFWTKRLLIFLNTSMTKCSISTARSVRRIRMRKQELPRPMDRIRLTRLCCWRRTITTMRIAPSKTIGKCGRLAHWTDWTIKACWHLFHQKSVHSSSEIEICSMSSNCWLSITLYKFSVCLDLASRVC